MFLGALNSANTDAKRLHMPISFLSLSRIFKWSCILCLIWQTWSKPAVQQDGFQTKYSPQSGRNSLDIGALISELLGLDSDFYFRRLTSKLPHKQKAIIRTPGGLFLPSQGHSNVYMQDCLQSNPASVSWTHIAQGWSPLCWPSGSSSVTVALYSKYLK